LDAQDDEALLRTTLIPEQPIKEEDPRLFSNHRKNKSGDYIQKPRSKPIITT
jgi:hypothetical protein